MTYEQVEEYINDIPKFTKKNKPEHTRQFLELLGNPQEKFKVIHVAGSNGKGSVCAYIDSVLRTAGKSSGLFISPHLVELTERFQINGENCSKEAFLAANTKVEEAVKKLAEAGMPHPTFFEYLFGLGMVIFGDADVEYAVLETGLGGRLDATNVVEHPIMTVITSISLEHTEILGDTIEQIAAEKAGIIKRGVPIVYSGKVKAAAEVIRRKSENAGAPAYEVEPERLKLLDIGETGLTFEMTDSHPGERFHVPFPAEYQMENAALAVQALDILKEAEGISDEAVKSGLADTKWPGRMERVAEQIYFDGAHNTDGMEQFIRAAKRLYVGEPVLLFSMVKEKDYREVIRELAVSIPWKKIFVTRIQGSREVPAQELGELFLENGSSPVEVIEDNAKALEAAMAEQNRGTLFCTGSLYLIGELKKIMEGKAC